MSFWGPHSALPLVIAAKLSLTSKNRRSGLRIFSSLTSLSVLNTPKRIGIQVLHALSLLLTTTVYEPVISGVINQIVQYVIGVYDVDCTMVPSG